MRVEYFDHHFAGELPDHAHSTREFANLRYGVSQARRGWLARNDVLNTRPLAELLALLHRPAGNRIAGTSAADTGSRRGVARRPRTTGAVTRPARSYAPVKRRPR